MGSEQGQASIEWVGLVLVVTLALGGLVTVAPGADGRSLGGFVAHRIACAVRGGCDDGDAELVRAYGRRDAAMVRRQMPGLVFEPGERELPVDWRECRAVACATVPDDRELDAHRTDAGLQATVFTRLLRRSGRRYVQYWTYYPDSNTTWAGSDRAWRLLTEHPGAALAARLLNGSKRYPGYHPDDWEGFAVSVNGAGGAAIRATSHGHWQWCKHWFCKGLWGPATGWARVSKGSHSGHVPLVSGGALRERTATADGIRLVPLEGLDLRRYRPLDAGIKPPWLKQAYENPESSES